MVTYQTQQIAEFPVEFLSNLTGAGVATPTNPKLFVVKPGQETAELVVLASFVTVSGSSFKVIVPADTLSTVGLYTFFVVSEEAKSARAYLIQVGGEQEIGKLVVVPFTGRDSAFRPISNLIYSDVTLYIEGVALSSRAVPVAEFVQLEDDLFNPQPFYLVHIHSAEVDALTMVYHVTAATITAVTDSFVAVEDVVRRIIFRLDPFLPGVLVEILVNGVLFAAAVTDTAGEVTLDLPTGDYVVRISKTGLTFNTNNVLVSISEETLELVVLDGGYTNPVAASVGFCKIDFRLMRPDGTPSVDTKVYFVPTLLVAGSGEGVLKRGLTVRTNANGEGVVNLVVGMEVLVNVEGTRLREAFTVPNIPTANLFSLITFEDKGFEFFLADFDDGIRRSLIP